ncbi:MAG: cellulose synthase complex periplasmic endoglucanase BcsZ [Stenotrophomonas sp.]
MTDLRAFRPMRRRLLQALAVTPLLACSRTGATRRPGPWTAWEVMRSSSVTADGRMVDHSNPDQRSTSEGQSYALFFALLDNDQPLFDRILRWTEDNLAGGSMAKRLPAWLWGQEAASGAWKVLDDNSASDSDLWLAYTLLEAARLWRRPALQQTGEAMLAAIQAQEVVEVPGLGLMLLPAPRGFVSSDTWRLNPSYLPLPLLRRFAALDGTGPWAELAVNSVRLLRETSPHGFAPDWTGWRAGGVTPDPATGALGSYDAIRCYLWAGVTDRADPLSAQVLTTLNGPMKVLRAGGVMPEKVDTRTGTRVGTGGYGFQAALLPYLQVQGQSALASTLAAGLRGVDHKGAAPPEYYPQMLVLFGLGWYEGRYRFAADGRVRPAWV